ncbi:Type 1 glutamine amidotransferase-like domain-containing protein [Paraburkholderia terrae]|uniref:Type 1 glutamine amidotransferase-like domain-containing protein n=1 Tax=Paraburkholderia terrae TaxID=311230 RepID=UPI000694FA13|nr:Type 1 glutamine amidotransferase-like domain-containing protein [Paraburkholderia terrae]
MRGVFVIQEIVFVNQVGSRILRTTPYCYTARSIPVSDFHARLLEQDAIYVGGGNTKSALAVWREWELDSILRTAWEKGVLLAGMSAGAMCWFEAGLTDHTHRAADKGRHRTTNSPTVQDAICRSTRLYDQ